VTTDKHLDLSTIEMIIALVERLINGKWQLPYDYERVLGGGGCSGLVMMSGDKCLKNAHHIRTRMKIHKY
jgi:hypothetical protein